MCAEFVGLRLRWSEGNLWISELPLVYSAWLSGQVVASKGLYFVGVVNLVQQTGGKTQF